MAPAGQMQIYSVARDRALRIISQSSIPCIADTLRYSTVRALVRRRAGAQTPGLGPCTLETAVPRNNTYYCDYTCGCAGAARNGVAVYRPAKKTTKQRAARAMLGTTARRGSALWATTPCTLTAVLSAQTIKSNMRRGPQASHVRPATGSVASTRASSIQRICTPST